MERAGAKDANKGYEALLTAVEMINVIRQLSVAIDTVFAIHTSESPLSADQDSSLPGHSVKGTRRKGRELALQALYQIEITGDPSVAAVELFLSHFEGNAEAKEFARRLVSGVVSQSVEIDRLIATMHGKLEARADGESRSGDSAHGDLRVGFLPRHPVERQFG